MESDKHRFQNKRQPDKFAPPAHTLAYSVCSKEIRTKQLLSVLSATEAVKLGEIINRK
ncbi:hypothetical protein [Parabacteroides merdae]|uniref:hypothetical protein n=1 Tax=Parabacteroides merdae TaxID=46503 RepID=UPI0015F30010|nr:hypothetical protein [Parabacteroides merdae]